MDVVLETVRYISSAPYFWLSMGATTGLAIFIGALLYDGEVSNVLKGIISVLSYVIFVFFVTIMRINNTLNGTQTTLSRLGMAYSGLATIITVTVFWLAGVFIGVIITRRVRKHCRKEHLHGEKAF